MNDDKQVVATAVFGTDAENLDRTFLSFLKNKNAELHAFVVGENLPEKMFPEICYHLKKPTGEFGALFRETCYRRWEFIDELGADNVLLVDGCDVLCMQELPQTGELLRGASVGACVEHMGSRYILGQGITTAFLNAGVTFWNVSATEKVRRKIIERGLSSYRTKYVDDQLSFNEVVQTLYYDELIILPCQYNFRYCFGRKRRNWPTVDHLDGIKLYHNKLCIENAKNAMPVKEKANLLMLKRISAPKTKVSEYYMRLKNRIKNPHIIR